MMRIVYIYVSQLGHEMKNKPGSFFIIYWNGCSLRSHQGKIEMLKQAAKVENLTNLGIRISRGWSSTDRRIRDSGKPTKTEKIRVVCGGCDGVDQKRLWCESTIQGLHRKYHGFPGNLNPHESGDDHTGLLQLYR